MDIIDLEKVYWNLKEQSKSGKLDLETLLPMIHPPLPSDVCESFFNAFDENRDGHIDFKEMACGISAACGGPLTERQKCMIYVCFDVEHWKITMMICYHCLNLQFVLKYSMLIEMVFYLKKKLKI